MKKRIALLLALILALTLTACDTFNYSTEEQMLTALNEVASEHGLTFKPAKIEDFQGQSAVAAITPSHTPYTEVFIENIPDLFDEPSSYYLFSTDTNLVVLSYLGANTPANDLYEFDRSKAIDFANIDESYEIQFPTIGKRVHAGDRVKTSNDLKNAKYLIFTPKKMVPGSHVPPEEVYRVTKNGYEEAFEAIWKNVNVDFYQLE